MATLTNIKENLINKKEELLERLERIRLSKRKVHDTDSSEQAIERENDEVVDVLGESIIKEIEQIDNALYRISKNVYDVCSRCHKKIPPERLEALPYTDRCINCAGN